MKGEPMQRLAPILFSLIFFVACGKQGDLFPRLEKDSPVYQFYKDLAARQPLTDPDKDVALLETSEFKLSTGMILKPLYQDIFNYTMGDVEKFKTEPPAKIRDFITRGAERLAENKLMLIDAKKVGYKAEADTVTHFIQEMYQEAGGEENFLKNLEKRHLTIEDVRREVSDNHVLDEYLAKVVFGNIQIPESEILAIYNQERVATIQHILMITKDKSPEAKNAIRNRMEQVYKQAKAGQEFAKLAQAYSEDPGSKNKAGVIRNIKRGDLFPEIDEKIFTLPVGEVSEVVESRLGFHLIKVIERNQDLRPFNEVKTEIVNDLTQPAKEKALRDKVNALKAEYQMKIVVIPQ
jgi:parvulin-like peptidyl-prolyl isomerase